MRYGIISDTHGNTEALNACLEVLEAAGAERIACLGDTVGYGAEPDECCDIVRRVAHVVVLGNHDAMAVGRLDPDQCHSAAREALDYAALRLSPENRAWLEGLSYEVAEGSVRFCHGSPLNVEAFDYLFTLDMTAKLTGAFNDLADVTFVGHSHLTTAYLVTPRMALQVCSPRVRLRPGVKYVFNVGSVGQPRDRDRRSCCVLYDTEEQIVQYLRVPYDVDAAAAKIYRAQLPQSFGQRLYHGV